MPMIEHWWGFATMPENMTYPSNGEDNPMTLICQFKLGDLKIKRNIQID